MNPRLSLQGRMSLDGWNGAADRGMDIHMGGVGGGHPGRHGRQSSLYRAQSTTLFNAFEGTDGDAVIPNGSAPHHKRGLSTDLHQLREAEEWEEDEVGDEHDDQRTLLNKGKRRQQQQQQRSSPTVSLPLGRNGGSRSHSHSPVPDSSLTDVRITPRP